METATLVDGWSVAAVVWGVTWKASVLVALLLLLGRLAHRAAAAVRHRLWAGATVALVILPLLDVGLQWRIDILPSLVALEDIRPAMDGGDAIAASSEDGELVAPVGGAGARQGSSPWGNVPALAWLVGSSVVLVRLLAGWRTAGRVVRDATSVDSGVWSRQRGEAGAQLGLTRTIPLVRSRQASMPFTAGILRPVVVLPWACDAWSPERRRAVLVHELAHVRRRDQAFHLLAHVACALHWFNPLVWLTSRRLRAESERACDDLVLRSGVRASSYAADLLDIVRASASARAPATAIAMAQASEFEGRLMAILQPGILRRAPSRRMAGGILAAVVAAAVPLAALDGRAVSEPTDVQASAAADTAALSALLRVLASDAAPRVRATAAWSLGQIADPRSMAGLSAAARDADAEVRMVAMWALQELDDDRALPAFLRALGDPSVDVRRMAARGIADLSLAEAPAELLSATADPDSMVRRIATWALGEIR